MAKKKVRSAAQPRASGRQAWKSKPKPTKASSAARVRGGALIGKPPAVSYKDPALVSYKDPGAVFIKEAYKIN